MNYRKLIFQLSLLITISLSTISCSQEPKENTISETEPVVMPEPVPEPKFLYGIQIDSFEVKKEKVKRHQNLSEILNPRNVDFKTIDQLAKKSKKIFDVRKIKTGNSYTLLCERDSNFSAKYMIYEKNPIEYVVFDLRDSVNIYESKKPVDTVRKTLTGVIYNSLYMTILENEGNIQLVNELAEMYAWQIDFFRIQKNDKFKVIYEELYVDGRSVGLHNILAAQFEHFGEDFSAYYFFQDADHDYFDDNGESLRKAFLKAPLKYSRISSKYTLRRFHPVQKRYKSHLGTDYAAPRGTPIYAVGDGVITDARYRRYNGNYVKIRHNSTYTTQYLHMHKIKSGIKPGKTVKQGDVIGYVGSTGLANGPHCCFRFWKNGVQVNPFKQKIPPSKPVAEVNMEAFRKVQKKYKKQLDKLEYPKEDIINWDSTDARISMQSSFKPYL